MNWSTKHVRVTGSTGFIGSHLTEALLEKGAHVTALAHYNSRQDIGWLRDAYGHKNLEIVFGDVRDSNRMADIVLGQDIVFHLAALIGIPYSYHAPRSYYQTNVEGTLNILEACRYSPTLERLVVTSSSEVYGTATYVPMDEKHPLNAQSPYAASKTAADQLALAYHKSFDLPVSVIRPFNTYGPRQSPRAFIPTVILQCLKGDEVVIGNPNPRRDYTYISDTVNAFIRMAESDNTIGEVINTGTGQAATMGSVAREIVYITGNATHKSIEFDPKRTRPRSSEVTELCADPKKARNYMQWTSTVDLNEGLEKTVAWFNDNLHLYEGDTYAL